MTNQTNVVKYTTSTILNGQTTSGEISCELVSNGLYQLHAIEFPAAMTGTSVTFTGSRVAGATSLPIRDVGGASAYTVTVTAGAIVPVNWPVFASIPYVKIVSNSAELADRSLVIHLRRIS